MKLLPTEDLVITRKRKKYKFAHFDFWQNCFTHTRTTKPAATLDHLNTYFQGLTLEIEKRPLVLELAAGNAQFSLELARRHPENVYIAIDIKSDRLYTSAKNALAEGLKNIVFLRISISELESVFEIDSVTEIWLTFPDPHPKKRSAKHRLTHPTYLRQYRKILKSSGELKFKTDNTELFQWSLEQFVAEKWHFKELSFDLHESGLSDEYKVMTYYEQRFIVEGIATKFVSLAAD